MSAPGHAQAPGLEVIALGVRYRNRQVVDALSFTARAGQVSVLIGPNGAGKSSVLKAILGLVPRVQGSVLWQGTLLERLSRSERARTLAYVPQRSLLLAGMSVASVVATGRYAHAGLLGRRTAADTRAVAEALALVDAHGLAERRFDELSGGESQRVLLARAYATGAQALLLDEPTSGQDLGHALSTLALLRRLAERGCCVLCVLHRLDEVQRVADQVVLLSGGRLLACGRPEAVLASPGLTQAFGVVADAQSPGGFRLAQGRPA